MALDFEKRAAANFRSSREMLDREFRKLIAERAAAKTLQSGATAKRSLALFEEHTSLALGKSLEEMAKHVDDRGRSWDAGATGIGKALDQHLSDAPTILKSPLAVAGIGTGTAASMEIANRLNRVGDKLREQLAEFHEGWTSPTPKPWKERHPNLDRILFITIGAVISAVGALISGLFA